MTTISNEIDIKKRRSRRNRATNRHTTSNQTELEVIIKKITFDGFDNFNTRRLSEIITENLSRILSKDDSSVSLMKYENNIYIDFQNSLNNITISRIDAGVISVRQNFGLSYMGKEIASSIASGLVTSGD